MCLISSLSLYGQVEEEVIPSHFFRIQGGFLSAPGPKYDYKGYHNDYTGYGILNLSWMKEKGKILQGLELELVEYEVLNLYENGTVSIFKGEGISQKSAELSYFRSIAPMSSFDNGFFFGFTGALGFFSRKNRQLTNSRASLTNRLCMSIGARLDYSARIVKRLYLNLSTRLILLDRCIYKTKLIDETDNTELRSFTSTGGILLRKQYALMLGLAFKL